MNQNQHLRNTHDTIVDKYSLDLSDFERGIHKVVSEYDDLNQKTKALSQQNPFKKQSDDLVKLNTQLRSGGDLFKKLATAPAAFKTQISSASAELIKLASNQEKAGKAGNWKQRQTDIAKTKVQITELNKELGEVPKVAAGTEAGFGKIGSAVKAAFTATGILLVIDAVVELGKKLIDVTGTSEKYQNQFTRIFDGNKEAAKGYLKTGRSPVASPTNEGAGSQKTGSGHPDCIEHCFTGIPIGPRFI